MSSIIPEVSVVIATYKRPIELDRCLRALLQQTFRHFEIIVADDSATHNSVESQTRLQIQNLRSIALEKAIDLRYVPVTGTQGPAAARNVGWRSARAGIIAFTDDDTVPTPTWLEEGLRYLRDGHADVVSGAIVVPLPPHPTDYEKNMSGLERAPFVTANCFYRRSVLDRAGGFDERYTMAWREDTDLWFTALDLGCSCLAVNDAVVVHPVRPASWGISIKEQRKTLFNALLYKKHPERCQQTAMLPRNPRYYWTAMAAMLSIMLNIAPSVSASLPHDVFASSMPIMPVGLLFMFAWLALTLEFALQRLRGTSHSVRHVTEMLVTSAVIPILSLWWRIVGSMRFRVFYL